MRNLSYMRAFAEAYPDEAIVQQPAAQLPTFLMQAQLLAHKPQLSSMWLVHALM